MRSMSNIFYNYLSDKIIKHFLMNKPMAGEKYYVQFETDDQVKRLYQELSENTKACPFLYEDVLRAQRYETYEIDFDSVQLIVAAALEGGPHPDFLATLRNLVGIEEGYTNKSILFIHCSSLDSILGGAGSLGKEGMPLNIELIKKDIESKINKTEYSITDKAILKKYLENKSKELDDSTASIFEYKDIIESLSDSQISVEEYRRFELFPDEKLYSLSGKNLENRIEENHQNYVKVFEIHSYGMDREKLERLYGEEGAEVLSKPEWESVQYSEIEKFIANKKKKTTIEYIPIISNERIWDKEEGQTKAKNRTRNILIFADEKQSQVAFSLTFSEFTKKEGIDIEKTYRPFLKVANSGKKLSVELSGIEDRVKFCRFMYHWEKTKFDFKIAVVRCNPAFLENIRTLYRVEIKNMNDAAIRIHTTDDEVILNKNGINVKNIKITENEQIVLAGWNDCLSLTISEDYPYSEESEDVHFSLVLAGFVIPMIKAFTSEKPSLIEGAKLWYLKRTRQCDFGIQGENSLIFGSQNYYTRNEFRVDLELEQKYIKLGSPFVLEKPGPEKELKIVKISLPAAVRETFDDIIAYFVRHNKIPSLTYVDDELGILYIKYIDTIIEAIESIEEGSYLNEEEKGMFCLGMVKRQYGDQEILLSPLHPINIAYQLFINDQNIDGLKEEEFGLLRRFQQASLLPYINIDPYDRAPKVYLPVEQNGSPEWKVYVEESLPRYKSSKDFVSKLVAAKIREFIEHFSYLFSPELSTPIKINLINTGDCREIVQGIVKYYVHEINITKSKKVIPIQITMYSDSKMDTAFEMMSQVDDSDVLVKTLGIEARIENMGVDEVIDIYRNNISFYVKNVADELEYAHITFMEMDDDHQAITTEMNDISSGVVMSGIASGVSSVMLGDSYRTGFGTKYANTNSRLLNIAIKYNALNAAMNGSTYRCGSCYTLKMGLNRQKMLNRVYDASNWVVFIDPKVDLSYFKSDPNAKDLLIIHYSDQYNMASSGYDAITVTRKSKQYQNAICRYLRLNGVEEVEKHSKKIINMFNALNGEWLLRMLSYKSHFSIEKLSILSAMKLAVKRYSIEGIIWIPVSLEEILRVSGSVGLRQNESDFSPKNLGFEGSTSDDLLLIGIKDGEEVKVTFYPIEVKIGKNESDYLEKGVKQALKTRQIFDEILLTGDCLDKNIKTRLYRNFFMQQVIINAGKMMLYDVGDDELNWNAILQSDLRRKLLNEEYEIVESLIPQMGKAGLISFKEDCFNEREIRHQEVLIIEKTKKEGVNLLEKEFKDISGVDWKLVKDTTDLATVAQQNIHVNDKEDTTEKNSYKDNQNAENKQEESKERRDEAIRVLVGEDRYNRKVFWEFGDKALANRHLLITGTSGNGKTYSIQTMLYELAKKNVSSVIFDYTEGFMTQHLEEPFKNFLGDRINQKIIYSTGVPINPFQRQQVELMPGEMILEKESDVAARLADIFAHVYNFGDQQYAAIFEAVYNGLIKYENKMNMNLFKDELEQMVEKNKIAKSVLSKMSPFFHTVEFSSDTKFNWGDMFYADEAKVNIIQLTMFSQDMKIIITEMMLWDAWYYTKKFGSKDKPFVVVLDEAQNLSHAMKSPSASILTEGRKFGWSAWFATQSLSVLKNDEIVRLMQAAFKLYFKPADNEIVKTAKQLDATGEADWIPKLQKLQKGQCIVAGDRMKANGTVGSSDPVVTDISSFEKRAH